MKALVLVLIVALCQIGSVSAQIEEACLSNSRYQLLCAINGQLINLSEAGGGEMGYDSLIHYFYQPDGTTWGVLHRLRDAQFEQHTVLYLAATGESQRIPYFWPDDISGTWGVFPIYRRLGQDHNVHSLLLYNFLDETSVPIEGSGVIDSYSYSSFSPSGRWLTVRTEPGLTIHQINDDGITQTTVLTGVISAIWTISDILLTVEDADIDRRGGAIYEYTFVDGQMSGRRLVRELSFADEPWYFTDYQSNQIYITTGNGGLTLHLNYISEG